MSRPNNWDEVNDLFERLNASWGSGNPPTYTYEELRDIVNQHRQGMRQQWVQYFDLRRNLCGEPRRWNGSHADRPSGGAFYNFFYLYPPGTYRP